MAKTKTAHTPGAVRAARIIHGNRYDPPGHANIRQCHTCNELAEIIDRETKAPQMLEALKRGHINFIQSNNLSVDDCEVLDNMLAAIRAAKGEL